MIWYYDTIDIAPYLKKSKNEIRIIVLRYFAATRAAMPFERTSFPGMTVVGRTGSGEGSVDLCSRQGWLAQVDESVLFPTGLLDDVFLHVSIHILLSLGKIY